MIKSLQNDEDLGKLLFISNRQLLFFWRNVNGKEKSMAADVGECAATGSLFYREKRGYC